MRTLFMLMSLDGKITTGDNDKLDFDTDLIGIKGIQQYYDIEKTMDNTSLVSAKTMAKIGVNNKIFKGNKIPITLVVVENTPYLTLTGLEYLADKYNNVHLIRSERSDYVICDTRENIEIDSSRIINMEKVLSRYKDITIQTGSELNAHLLKLNLIDKIRLIIAPIIVGGRETKSLVGGESFHNFDELQNLIELDLECLRPLNDSFIETIYKVKPA